MDASTTRTLVTLEDGSVGIRHTVSLSWSASFSWRTGGAFSVDEADVAASIAADSSSNQTPLPSGQTIEVTQKSNAFASGSVAGSFTATATIPFSGNLLDADFAISLHFAMSSLVGGSSSSTTKVFLDESSGSESDSTDTFTKIDIDNSSSSSYSTGSSFWIGVSSGDESAEDGSAATVASDAANNGTESSGAGTESSSAGTQSAQQLIEDQPTGAQFTFAASSSGNENKSESIAEKTRYTSVASGNGYRQVSVSESGSTASDSHITFAAGTEQMLLDVGFSGSHFTNSDISATHLNTVEYSEPGSLYTTKEVQQFTEVSSSSYNFGIVLGGENPGITNESSFSVNVTAADETHWDLDGLQSAYILKEVYRNHSDSDQDSETTDPASNGASSTNLDTDPIHRKTEQYTGVGDDTIFVIFEQVPGQPAPEETASAEEKLAEYRDRREKIERWKNHLATLTDPGQIKYFQNLIDAENDHLKTVRQAAEAAGVTTQQLADADAEAISIANSGDPIDQQTGEGDTFFNGTWFSFPAFVDTFGGEIGAIGDGFIGIYHSLAGNSVTAQDYYANAYENGPLGLTVNSGGFYYWGTRGFLGIASAAASAAIIVGATEVAMFGRSAIFAARGEATLLVESGGLRAIFLYGKSVSNGILQIRPTGGAPIIRLDYHAIAEGGRRLLHLDFNRWGIGHWPW